jgi:hypothetical protein
MFFMPFMVDLTMQESNSFTGIQAKSVNPPIVGQLHNFP